MHEKQLDSSTPTLSQTLNLWYNTNSCAGLNLCISTNWITNMLVYIQVHEIAMNNKCSEICWFFFHTFSFLSLSLSFSLYHTFLLPKFISSLLIFLISSFLSFHFSFSFFNYSFFSESFPFSFFLFISSIFLLYFPYQYFFPQTPSHTIDADANTKVTKGERVSYLEFICNAMQVGGTL